MGTNARCVITFERAWDDFGRVLVCFALLSDVACSGGSWVCFDDEECVGCAWDVCDGLDRCCDESVVCVVCEEFLSVWDVRRIVMIFE